MDVTQTTQSHASSTNLKVKPALPKKPVKLKSENDVKRTTHVRDMIRKLQERERSNGTVEQSFTRTGGKLEKTPASPERAEADARTSHQTLEDLKAIDEDIEKLRRQIEDRDKIITALREAAEVKDKKLDDLMVECSKLRSGDDPRDMGASPDSGRGGSSPPSSPAFCSGDVCWTSGFVGAKYRELFHEHTVLQNACNDFRSKFGPKTEGFQEPRPEQENREGAENAINLIMAEQIRLLKEREAQLIWEAEELREQNDLMEFRILELEECRKEFLDKEMMSEGKHRAEKIVWRERDLEEISDSGVVSLPTSEDLTSDSELGDAIRNYSPLGAVANLGLSVSDNSHSDPAISDLKLKKSLKSAECLQESGIFVDADSSDGVISAGSHSKACQTESILDKTLLDLIDSSCDLFLSKNPGYLDESRSDDLTTEISKLSVIQRRIQQKARSPTPRNPHAVVSCPHANSLVFYEERLGQLEDKLKIYESSGDAQDILLAKRLQKEVELARRVKELTNKVASLEALNKKLEEEKCEFEEAENDARFQCQRLEVRLQELIDKNADLELEVERRKAMMSEEKRKEKKKGSLEGLINKYEKRNFELEEKEMEAKRRLSMIEAAMPAIVAYNVFKLVQKPELEGTLPLDGNDAFLSGKKAEPEDGLVLEKLEEALGEQRQEKTDGGGAEESAADREKTLRNKIRKLEVRADQDRAALEELTNSLNAYQEAEKSARNARFSRPDDLRDVDLLEELKHMVANEIDLRAQIERLEKKEQAYMQSLEKADEIWAGMEADYKRRLHEAEEANEELQKRISRLEVARAGMEKALTEAPSDTDLSKLGESFRSKIQQLSQENEKLKAELNRSPEESLEEQRKVLETENSSLKEELRKMETVTAKEEKRHQLLQKELEFTRAELLRERGIGEKLRKDLEERNQSVLSMETNLQSQISKLTQELGQKSKELSSLEVTVAELREEVETLENKVGELVETIQTMMKNQEEVSTMVRAKRELSEWAAVDAVTEDEEVEETPPIAEETFEESENKASVPSEPRLTVYPISLSARQETRFVFARCEFARLVFLGTSERLFHSEVPGVPNKESQDKEKEEEKEKEIEKEDNAREEEIFQLSIRNTELQQTLERMDEESKLKDKELEELQKVALEIRKEQEKIMLSYARMGDHANKNVEELAPRVCDLGAVPSSDALSEAKPTASIDFLQIVNPIVIKTSEQDSPLPSSLQIAIDNLQSKCRWKSPQDQPLVDEGRASVNFVKHPPIDSTANGLPKEKKLERRATDLPLSLTRTVDKSPPELVAVGDFLKPSTPLALGSPALVTSAPFKRRDQKPNEAETEFSFAAPITTVRKVGDDGIFLEWDVTQQPEGVVGFEIKVNGLLSHRVRSSTRNKALLRPLNLKDQISIHLFAVTKAGRSSKSSHVIYPNEYFLQSEGSSYP